MLALHSQGFDEKGVVILDIDYETSSFGETSRRRSRVQTLDGGYVVEDRGSSIQDRSFSLTFSGSEETVSAVRRLVQLYPQILVSSIHGLFRCSVEKLNEGTTMSYLNLDVEEQYA
ncbi:hypothetical protein J2Y86_000927 [Pseudomonas migulae]|uniref:hypothetical protein n=1 Tax=Pseudomonas migulae TaxID=78543 RepID=UPI00209FB6F3|nr:hypothetical protein [Pseudomonas migulae]MCP1496220.1 hypothetical protein [Pseudomonas migulae]